MLDSRDALIEAVQYGHISPGDADAKAKRLGLKPLSFEPETAAFDPMCEMLWTPAMAVAWIAWRTPDAVRHHWDAFRAECRDWHFRRWRVGSDGQVREGHVLESRRPATLSGLRLLEAYEKSSQSQATTVMAISDAVDALWIALGAGYFQATALSSEGGPRTSIPAQEWIDLTVLEQDGVECIASNVSSLNHVKYRGVMVPRVAVVGFWRELEPKTTIPPPPLIRPDGGGYMPLFSAAFWIASEGGARAFDLENVNVWKPAYADLLARLSSGNVRVTGIKDGERREVEGFRFADCLVDYPFTDTPADLFFGKEPYLTSYPYMDDERWRKGFDDSLGHPMRQGWSRLMVLKEDVARFWPFQLERKPGTGAPGRPSSMHLIEVEFEQRIAEGRTAQTLADEARALEHWLRVTHPTFPRAGKTAIENRIRPAFNRNRPPRK